MSTIPKHLRQTSLDITAHPRINYSQEQRGNASAPSL